MKILISPAKSMDFETKAPVESYTEPVFLDQAERLSLPVKICRLDMEDLQLADEVFVCNSLIGIWPVIAVDGRPYCKGEITRRMQQQIQAQDDDGSAWHP